MKEMNFSKHFLLIELKRKMLYKLQNVNTVKNIYELAQLTQLKENHYKRIDDIKTRRQSDAVIDEVITAETKAYNLKIITIITTINKKISISNKSSQISFERSQFFVTLRNTISRTSNSDSVREILMKKNKCFNCFEIDHISKNCFKSKKFRVAKINMKNENSKKE